MTKSPFRNFDLEKVYDADPFAVYIQPGIGTYGISQLLLHCCATCMGNGLKIDNKKYAAIVEQIHPRDEIQRRQKIGYSDYLQSTPTPPIRDISHAQYHAVRAIMLVDEVLDLVALDGWCIDAVDKLLLASAWLSDASSNQVETTHQRTLKRLLETRLNAVERGVAELRVAVGRSSVEKAKRKKGTKIHSIQLQKELALKLYKEGIDKGNYTTQHGGPLAAARKITTEVQRYAAKENLIPLKEHNAEDTIYKHLLNSVAKKSKTQKFKR